MHWTQFYTFDWIKIHRLRYNFDQLEFENCIKNYFDIVEGCVLYPYMDYNGHWHIGNGLLLKDATSDKLTNFATKILHESEVELRIPLKRLNSTPLTKIERIQYSISKIDCTKLLLAVIRYNYRYIFDSNLPKNKLLALHSICYLNPSTLRSSLGEKLMKSAQLEDYESNINNLSIIENNFNRPASHGIFTRRFMESAMFSNNLIDFVYRIPKPLFQKATNHFKFELQNCPLSFYNQTHITDPKLPKISAIYRFIQNNNKRPQNPLTK